MTSFSVARDGTDWTLMSLLTRISPLTLTPSPRGEGTSAPERIGVGP